MWTPGTWPPTGSARSIATSSPAVSAAVWRNTMRSPVTGFSTVCPAYAISVPFGGGGESMREEHRSPPLSRHPPNWRFAARPGDDLRAVLEADAAYAVRMGSADAGGDRDGGRV